MNLATIFCQKFMFQNNKEKKTINYVTSQLSKHQHLYTPISQAVPQYK